jgi:hypothetical protein
LAIEACTPAIVHDGQCQTVFAGALAAGELMKHIVLSKPLADSMCATFGRPSVLIPHPRDRRNAHEPALGGST